MGVTFDPETTKVLLEMRTQIACVGASLRTMNSATLVCHTHSVPPIVMWIDLQE